MTSILIGVYDSSAEAQGVLGDLAAQGFPRRLLQIGLPDDTPDGRQALLRRLNEAEEPYALADGSTSLPEFFRAAFGDNRQPADGDLYMEAVRRGSCLLIVDAETDEQRNQALDVMMLHGPVDIEERSAQWRRQGWPVLDEDAAFDDDDDDGEMFRGGEAHRLGVRIYQRVC